MQPLWEVWLWRFPFQNNTVKDETFSEVRGREESKQMGWKRRQRYNWLCQDAICSVYTLWCVPGHPRRQFSWFCPFILQIRTLDFGRIHVYGEGEAHIRLDASVWASLEKAWGKVNVSLATWIIWCCKKETSSSWETVKPGLWMSHVWCSWECNRPLKGSLPTTSLTEVWLSYDWNWGNLENYA